MTTDLGWVAGSLGFVADRLPNPRAAADPGRARRLRPEYQICSVRVPGR